MVELLPNDTIRPKLIASPSGPLAQAWATRAPAGGRSSLTLVAAAEAGAARPAGTAARHGDLVAIPARAAVALTGLVLGAAALAVQPLLRRRQQARSSPATRWPAAQERLQPAQDSDDLEYRLM